MPISHADLLAVLFAEVTRAVTALEDGYTRGASGEEIAELQRLVDASVKHAHHVWGEDAKREYLERKAREARTPGDPSGCALPMGPRGAPRGCGS
jgi:hypothetical protein